MFQTTPQDSLITVIRASGEVYAESPEGSVRALVSGDSLVPGEVVKTADGRAQVQFGHAPPVDLGRYSSFRLPLEGAPVGEPSSVVREPSSVVREPVDNGGGRPADSGQYGQQGVPEESHLLQRALPEGGGSLELSGSRTTPILSPAVNFLTPPGITGAPFISSGSAAPLTSSSAAVGYTGRAIGAVSGANVAPADAAATGTTASVSEPETIPEPQPESQPESPFSLQTDAENVRATGQLISRSGVLGNDTFPEGSRVSHVNAIPIPAGGSITVATSLGSLLIHSDGTYTYSANDIDTSVTTNSNDQFTYTVTDRDNNTASSTLTITHQESFNHAPEASDQNLILGHAQTSAGVTASGLGLVGQAYDRDGDAITLVSVNGTTIASSGTTNISGQYGTLIVAANGTYSFVPLDTAVSGGTEAFTYILSDGTTTTEAKLTVEVTPAGFSTPDQNTVYESEGYDNGILLYDREGSRLLTVDTDTGSSRVVFSGEPTFIDVSVTSANAVYGITASEVHRIDLIDGASSALFSHTVPGTVEGFTVSPRDGTLYAVNDAGVLYTVDTTDGTTTSAGDLNGTPVGGITWHDNAIYTVLYHGDSQQNWLTRVDLASDTVVPIAEVDTAYTALVSRNGDLLGINSDGVVYQLNVDNGASSLLTNTIGEDISGGSQFAFGQVYGNVLTNDTGATGIVRVTGADGQDITVNSAGVTVVQGQFGELRIHTDGSYTYHLDNSAVALDSVDLGETANDRFAYTATNSATASESENVLTIFINGALEVSTTPPAQISGEQHVYAFSSSQEAQSIVFNAQVNAATQRITGLRITGHEDGIISAQGELGGTGSIERGANLWEWTITPENFAGLSALNPANGSLSLVGVTSAVNRENNLHIELTVTEYNSDGSASSSRTSTIPYDATIVYADNTITGDENDNTLTGTSQSDFITGADGDDILTGGEGVDLFSWQVGDIGTPESPATDTITDFELGRQGDVLNIADLIPAAANEETLDQYIGFGFDNGSTTVRVSTAAGGNAVQNIILQDVDFSAVYGTTDTTALLNTITDNGNLIT